MQRPLLILGFLFASPALGAGDPELPWQVTLPALGLVAALIYIGFVVIRGCIRLGLRVLR
jgi:hypothetical protein